MRTPALSRWAPIAAAFISLLIAASPSRATVVMQLTTAEMSNLSDAIVRAQVVSQSSQWSDDHRQMITLTRLHVLEYWKGQGATELVLRQFGGTIGDLHSAIAGDGTFTIGETCVLFLKSGPGVVFLTALAQSVYHVASDGSGTVPVATRDLHDLTMARRDNGRIEIVATEPAAPTSVALAQLANEVRNAVRGGR